MCTSFAVYNQNNPIYGMNFDSDDIDLKLNIYNYADRDVFYFSGLMDNNYIDIAGINSNGLFICTQLLEYSPNFQPSSNGNNVCVFDVIEESLRVGDKVSDFLDILNNRNAFYSVKNPFFPNMGLHTIVADKYGDAVILEEGINTNIISKIDGKFIVMTNFPNGNFENQKFDEVCGCGADRYIKAYKDIDDKINNFGINDAFDVLRKTSQDTTSQAPTICSIVFEPLKLEAYICLKNDFDKKWKVSIKEKTIHSLNGLNNNDSIIFTTEGVIVKQLYQFYE